VTKEPKDGVRARIEFPGAVGVGSVIVGFFLGPVLLLLSSAITLAVATNFINRNPVSLIGVLIFDAYCLRSTRDFVRSLSWFGAVEIDNEDNWRLIGPLNRTLAIIAATAPRKVEMVRQDFKQVNPLYRVIQSGFLLIESEGRTHRSCRVAASELEGLWRKLKG